MIRALFIAALGTLSSAIALGQTYASEVGGEEDEV